MYAYHNATINRAPVGFSVGIFHNTGQKTAENAFA